MDRQLAGVRPLCVRVQRIADLDDAIRRLGVAFGRPVLVCVGGAGGLGDEHLAGTEKLLSKWVIPALEQWNVAVVDGGTDAGVMRVLGESYHSVAATFPLIGVVAAGTITGPDDDCSLSSDKVTLEAHHTHAVLVPGSKWGDESPWMSATATAIAAGRPTATLVINGGEITYNDIALSVAANRPVLVVGGSGRTADDIAGATTGSGGDARSTALAKSPLVHVVHLADADGVLAALRQALLS
ncbi:MAG TPA: hypothetical protein VFP89_09420 [Propionibacteriaceae bacterium]|nr:hypothetical protein [Propionibacteriaceae bacterium]